jgi:NhaP-type Na+/H+ or K+/H+ antiporter
MVGAALYFPSKFTVKTISGLVLLARYISALMTLRYGYSEPNTSSSSWRGRNGSVSFYKALTIMGVLDGYALSLLNFSNIFWT